MATIHNQSNVLIFQQNADCDKILGLSSQNFGQGQRIRLFLTIKKFPDLYKSGYNVKIILS